MNNNIDMSGNLISQDNTWSPWLCSLGEEVGGENCLLRMFSQRCQKCWGLSLLCMMEKQIVFSFKKMDTGPHFNKSLYYCGFSRLICDGLRTNSSQIKSYLLFSLFHVLIQFRFKDVFILSLKKKKGTASDSKHQSVRLFGWAERFQKLRIFSLYVF